MKVIDGIKVSDRAKDLSNRIYRNWRVVALHGHERGTRAGLQWLCQCECGALQVVSSGYLERNRLPLCTCGRTRLPRENHGRGGSPEYRTWSQMKKRCTNPRDPHYARYGGRGIAVCPEWMASFTQFLLDMGPRPSSDYTIDRIDNARGYEPGNCRWATQTQQANNRRTSLIVTHDGRQMTLADAARLSKIPYYQIWYRITRLHWSVARALSQPLRPIRKVEV